MSAWSVATWCLLPPLVVAVLFTLRGTVAHRFVAGQLAAGLTILILGLMSFAFDQDSFVDLALTLAFLNVAAGLFMAVAIERWL